MHRKRIARTAGFLLALLFLTPLVWAQTSDNENTTFNVNVNAVVRIDLASPAPADKTINTTDLATRYFTLDDLLFDLYAITNYRVTATKSTTGSLGAPAVDTANILQARIISGGFSPNEDGETSLITSFTAIPEDPATVDWMTGQNTQPGTDNKVRTTSDLQLDLAALGNNASGSIYTFQVSLTVTEE
ncbi:MAG: hypothetical protein A2Z21_03875 [Candidatus Fraserbacteria bacterium RBG_16_55_9]|uniref:Uncharacterized protein n=1 Tax=Fraserbacteria sp. (strain RBG_16_55_9) TaxID=1817864 RepID=A0A1F5UX94_FRAXR|nr:MAG: hypothetical protein A2Z21_03875 [Candidatus Fraserbacteria bacterium RBG_16_55_9]